MLLRIWMFCIFVGFLISSMCWCLLWSWFVFSVPGKKSLFRNVCYILGVLPVRAYSCICGKEQCYYIPAGGIALTRRGKPKLLVNPVVPPQLHYLTELMKLFVTGCSAAFGPRTVISGQISSVQQHWGQLISAPFSILSVTSEQHDHIRAAVTLTQCRNRFLCSTLPHSSAVCDSWLWLWVIAIRKSSGFGISHSHRSLPRSSFFLFYSLTFGTGPVVCWRMFKWSFVALEPL